MSITPVYLSIKTLDFPCYAGLPKSELYVVGNASWLNPKSEPETEKETVSHLQLSNEEKRTKWLQGLHEKVRAALFSPEWQNKSDRAIASFCGVSTPTVSKQRKHLQE